MEKLKGKKIVIAGATGSIGEQTAKHLLASGADVFLLAKDANRLGELVAELQLPSNRAFQVDITNREQLQQVAQKINEEISAPDVLINAVGIGIIKPFEQLSFEEFEKSISVNLYGTFHLLKSFLPSMKEQKKGLIINIPGVLGKTPMAGATAYSASKYGLNGMMKSLREELKRTDIRITQLFLGGVDSRFWDSIDLRVQRDKMIMAEEAAKAIWFLCQQPSSGVVSEMVIQPFNHQVI
jgi:short-subunit dehydrogenase